jgi:uncharacterized membrane protein
MQRAFRRVSVAAVLTTLAAAIPIVVAGPAEASAKPCAAYLKSQGYAVGSRIHHACQPGNGWLAKPACVVQLSRLGVTMRQAVSACDRATH